MQKRRGRKNSSTRKKTFIPQRLSLYLNFVPGVLLVSISLIILLGWFFESELIIKVHPSFSALNPLTACLFFVWGVSMVADYYSKKKLALFLSSFVLVVALSRIILDVLYGIRIDHILFLHLGDPVMIYSSGVSYVTAIGFIFFGLGGVVSTFGKKIFSLIFYSCTTALGFLGVLLYILPQSFLAGIQLFSSLALHTSLLLFIFGLVLVLGEIKSLLALGKNNTKFSVLVLTFVSFILFTLVLSLWGISLEYKDSELSRQFELNALNLETRILSEMSIYNSLLTGGVALFNGSDDVNRDEWNKYISTFHLENDFPGIQGIGYSIFIEPEELESHIESVRQEGFENYSVRPDGERDVYSSIIYLEPFADRNLAAFGYDMYSQETRRAAMDLAIQSGTPAMSGKVVLVQEIDEDVQAGFLVYVPVYKKGVDINAPNKTREDVQGFVYAVYRAGDLMNEIVLKDISGVDFILFDDGAIQENNKMFVSTESMSKDVPFSKTTVLNINEREWALYMQPAPGSYVNQTVELLPWVVTIGGGAFSVVLLALIFALLSSRNRAIAYAEKITLDIRKSRDALAEQYAKDDAIIASISDGLIVVDTKGSIVLVNKAFERILGWRQEDVLNKKFVDIVHLVNEKNRAIPKSRRPITKILHNKKELSIKIASNYYYKSYSGKHIPVTIELSPIFKEDDFLGVVLTFRDISSEKLVDKAKTEFVSLASHQLKAPLTAIAWTVESLLDAKISKKVKEQVLSIDEITNRMKKLVTALLNTSRIDLGSFKIENEIVDLKKLSRIVLSELQPLIQEKGIIVSTKIASSVKEIKADPNLMKVIIQNLLSNAVKYSGEGSKIAYTISKVRKKIRFTVEDQGMGISEEDQKRLFQKLFRGANAVKSSNEGTGLGLYIVKSILDEAGGKIWFESKEGKGTTFYVELPEKGMKPRDGTRTLS